MTDKDVSAQRTAVLGIDFGGTTIAAALADPTGRMVARDTEPAPATGGPEAVLRAGTKLVGTLRRTAEQRGLDLVAAAAVAPGLHHPTRSGTGFSPNLPDLDDARLAAEIATAAGVPTAPIWNDVHAAALAELRSGQLRDADPGVYVGLGTGIAAGICVGSRVLRGGHGAAGEIGYLSTGTGPSLGAAAGIAPLEEVVGGRALAERATALLGTPTSTADLFARADSESRQLLHHSLGLLATAIADLAVIIDPVRIVLGGGLMRSGELILQLVRAQVARQVPTPPQVTAAHHLADASLHGAIALAIDHHAFGRNDPS